MTGLFYDDYREIRDWDTAIFDNGQARLEGRIRFTELGPIFESYERIPKLKRMIYTPYESEWNWTHSDHSLALYEIVENADDPDCYYDHVVPYLELKARAPELEDLKARKNK